MKNGGYSDSGCSGWAYGWFPGTGNVISTISEYYVFSIFSESKIFSVVLLKKDGILVLTRISSGSKGFYRKTLKTPIWNLPLSWWQNDENDWTKVNNIIQLAWECHYMIMKDSPRVGKPFGNANNAFCVAITAQMYDFLMKNHGKSLVFHSFPCQNFPVVSPQPPPCLPRDIGGPSGIIREAINSLAQPAIALWRSQQ